MTVEHNSPSITTLHYQAFPFFADPIYEELTVHAVRALLRLCSKSEPPVTIERSDEVSLDLRIVHG